MIVRERAYARVGFVGNPSDGYYGKTIAFTIGNFFAEVLLYESPELELRPGPQDHAVFESMDDLVENVHRTGYYGGVRLLKAAVKTFDSYCRERDIELPDHNFTVRYSTSIPRQVGLGGSSAIITAVMRALTRFFQVDIPLEVLPNVVLSAESEELGLTAGLQDRVAQAYGGVVYMDFDEQHMKEHGHGRYERLEPERVPPVYVAYRQDLSKESSMAHIHVRERYELGEPEVVRTMAEIAALADIARALMRSGDHEELARTINRNFDLRSRIFDIRPEDRQMVDRARQVGASCKFCGSGGAVVGTYDGEEMLEALRSAMEGAGYRFFTPEIAPNHN